MLLITFIKQCTQDVRSTYTLSRFLLCRKLRHVFVRVKLSSCSSDCCNSWGMRYMANVRWSMQCWSKDATLRSRVVSSERAIVFGMSRGWYNGGSMAVCELTMRLLLLSSSAFSDVDSSHVHPRKHCRIDAFAPAYLAIRKRRSRMVVMYVTRHAIAFTSSAVGGAKGMLARCLAKKRVLPCWS